MNTKIQNYEGLRFAYKGYKDNLYYEMVGQSCPICNKTGWCLINMTTKNEVICGREPSKYETSNGQWKHYLNGEEPNFKKSNKKYFAPVEKLVDSELHLKYQQLLNSNFEEINLDFILEDLKNRKVSKEHCEIKQYVQLRDGDLSDNGENFKGVPGVFKHYSNWKIKAQQQRLYLPVRNLKQEVVGFQSRRYKQFFRYKITNQNDEFKDMLKVFCGELQETDEETLVVALVNGDKAEKLFAETCSSIKEKTIKVTFGEQWVADIELHSLPKYTWLSSNGMSEGTSAGGPLPFHLSISSKQLENYDVGNTVFSNEKIIITEGVLKGDIISELLDGDDTIGSNVLSIAGVNQFKTLRKPLEEMGVKTVYTAFDMDARTNAQVMEYYEEMLIMLIEMGMNVKVLVWEDEKGKGLDDLLANGFYPIVNELVYKTP